MVMECRLVHKHLAADAISKVRVAWTRRAGPPTSSVISDRTRDSVGVKVSGAIAKNTAWLKARSPNSQSPRDATKKDRFTGSSKRVSAEASAMRNASEDVWWKGKLGRTIVALPHPEPVAAVPSLLHELNTHLTTSPFHACAPCHIAPAAKSLLPFLDFHGR